MVDIKQTKTIYYDKPPKKSKGGKKSQRSHEFEKPTGNKSQRSHEYEFKKPAKKADMSDFKPTKMQDTEVARTPEIPEVHKYPDGSKYYGTHAFNMFGEYRKHGFGVFTWKDGKRYEGYWDDGKQHGQGCFTDKNGKHRIG